MYGFKPGAKPQEKAPQGKKIEGPGNGTSDSIKTDIPKGSYIMPADSTQQIGQKALGELGQPVPVNVSNGEYQIPPEQVHAVGVQALNQMRDATHTPAPAGFKPQNDGLYFADGGSPAEEERKRLAGAGPSPQMGAVALGNERRAERMSGEGMYGKANADVGGALNYLNRGDPMKDAASAVGGFFARSSDQARLADYGNTGTPSPIAATPAPVPTPPAAVGATELPSTKGRTDYGFTPDPGQGPAPGMRVSPTSVPEIQRIDNAPGLNSPLFTNLPAGEAVSGMQGGTVNSFDLASSNAAMAQANAARGGTEGQDMGFQPERTGLGNGVIGSGASDDAQSRNEMFARWGADSALFKAGIGKMGKRDAALLDASQKQYEAIVDQGLRKRELASKEGQSAADRDANLQRTAMQEAGANARSFSRDDIDRQRAAGEAQTRGFEARGLERVERFYQQLENAKTPEERAAVAEQLRAISGKEAPNRFTVVPGGQEIDPTTNMAVTRPARVFNNQSGQFVDQQPGAQALPPIAENPAVQKIMQNTALSREERAAQIRALGYK